MKFLYKNEHAINFMLLKVFAYIKIKNLNGQIEIQFFLYREISICHIKFLKKKKIKNMS